MGGEVGVGWILCLEFYLYLHVLEESGCHLEENKVVCFTNAYFTDLKTYLSI